MNDVPTCAPGFVVLSTPESSALTHTPHRIAPRSYPPNHRAYTLPANALVRSVPRLLSADHRAPCPQRYAPQLAPQALRRRGPFPKGTWTSDARRGLSACTPKASRQPRPTPTLDSGWSGYAFPPLNRVDKFAFIQSNRLREANQGCSGLEPRRGPPTVNIGRTSRGRPSDHCIGQPTFRGRLSQQNACLLYLWRSRLQGSILLA
jgi:hypothetical protein